MERTRRFQVASLLVVTTLLLGAPALAQTTVPGQAIPCSPPCGPGEMCVQGQCLVPAPPQDTTATPPPVEPAPAPVTAPPLPEAEVAAPAPAPSRRKKARPEKTAVEEDDEVPVGWRRGVLVMPFAGAHLVEGIAADDYDAGPRFGALVGVHASPVLSLNVELAMNILSPKLEPDPNLPRGLDLSGRDFTIAFSPLFHASSGIGEFVVGPKLGFWSSGLEATAPGVGTTGQGSQAGWAFGFNLGAFAGVTDSVAIGALVSYQMTYLSQTCSRSGGIATGICSGNEVVPQFLSFNIAALL